MNNDTLMGILAVMGIIGGAILVGLWLAHIVKVILP